MFGEIRAGQFCEFCLGGYPKLSYILFHIHKFCQDGNSLNNSEVHDSSAKAFCPAWKPRCNLENNINFHGVHPVVCHKYIVT
jgi:hypothetical protein